MSVIENVEELISCVSSGLVLGYTSPFFWREEKEKEEEEEEQSWGKPA